MRNICDFVNFYKGFLCHGHNKNALRKFGCHSAAGARFTASNSTAAGPGQIETSS
jgi:hypothetical protein